MRGYRTVINGLYVKIKKIGIICIVKNDSTHIIKFVVVSNARKLQNKQVVTLANSDPRVGKYFDLESSVER